MFTLALISYVAGQITSHANLLVSVDDGCYLYEESHRHFVAEIHIPTLDLIPGSKAKRLRKSMAMQTKVFCQTKTYNCPCWELSLSCLQSAP